MESSTPDHADHHAANNNNKKPRNNPNLITTGDHLRHVESMATMPSGAGNIFHPNAVILGESLASEENDLVFPNNSQAQSWVKSKVQAHLPATNITCIFVGNKVLTFNDTSLSNNLLPAMQSVHTALVGLGLDKQVDVTEIIIQYIPLQVPGTREKNTAAARPDRSARQCHRRR
ncbi:hypothetical protein ACFX12_027600 [Malus domestica]